MIETKLDEAALRRPDFRGGEPIELDGQAWIFPKPCVIYRPKFGAPRIGSRPTTDLGPEFDEAIAELDDLGRERRQDDPGSGRTFIDALMNIGAVMLRINYDLTDDQLGDLLAYRPDDESSQDTWLAITDVARGNGVKQMSDMTGSAC